MRVPWRDALPLLALIVLVALGAGCGSDRIIRPMSWNLRQLINDHPPNANQRIVLQRAFGDPARRSTVYQMAAGSDGGFGFRGWLDDRAGMGTLGPDGDPAALQSTVFEVRDLCQCPAASSAPGAFLVAGSHDTDGDGCSEQAYLSLLRSSGGIVDQLLVTSDTSDVWLNGVRALDDSSFIAVGGERRHGVPFPFIARVVLTPDRHVSIRARRTLESQSGRWLGQFALIPPPPGGSDLFVGALYSDSPRAVAGIHATLPDLADASLEWSSEVVAPTGSATCLYRVVRLGSGLAVLGLAEDGRKQPAPHDGPAWYSGLVAAYTLEGTQLWLTVVGEGDDNEELYDAVETPDGLLAVGTCDDYNFGPESGDSYDFGYGWVCRIRPADGAVLASLSFGPDRCSSGFAGASCQNGLLTCAGWTESSVDPGPFRGWFCRVDVSSTVAPRMTAASASTDRPAGARGRGLPRGRLGPGGSGNRTN